MSDPMSKTHSVTTIGPVRLEPLPDGRYMLHIEQPVTPEIDLEKLAHQVAEKIKLWQSMRIKLSDLDGWTVQDLPPSD